MPDALQTAERNVRRGGPLTVRNQAPTPRKIRNVRPEYPRSAQVAGLQGTVTLEATISHTGCVSSASVLEGLDPVMDFLSLRAVMGWRYAPAEIGGKPVPVALTVTVNFILQ